MTKVAELYGLPTYLPADWKTVAARQQCPFLDRKCLKNRKSEPEITIGTCTMTYGKTPHPTMICLYRLLERSRFSPTASICFRIMNQETSCASSQN